jgi:hypothetical protein
MHDNYFRNHGVEWIPDKLLPEDDLLLKTYNIPQNSLEVLLEPDFATHLPDLCPTIELDTV